MAKVAVLLSVALMTGALWSAGAAQAAAERDGGRQYAQQRPRIIVRPRHRQLSPNATRHCEAWLAVEHRPSGTVITPQQRCWWED